MSLKKLTNHSNSGDVLVEAYQDGDDLITGTTYDYTRLLESHQKTQAELDAKGQHKDMWKVADIPAHILDEAIRNGTLKDRKYWRAFVNNPENAAFVYERNGKKIRL